MNKKKLIIITITIVLLVTFFGCFYRVNAKYSDYIVDEHLINEQFRCGNLDIEVMDFNIYNPNELKKIFPDLRLVYEDEIDLIVDMKFTNNTDQVQIIDIEKFIMQTDEWLSYLYTQIIMDINNEQNFKLNPGDEINMKLPFVYIICDEEMTKEILLDQTLYLNCYISYPKLIRVKLN